MTLAREVLGVSGATSEARKKKMLRGVDTRYRILGVRELMLKMKRPSYNA